MDVGGDPVMFYNGADPDAAWRPGWIRFGENYERVLERCAEPLIVPPKPQNDDRDIAFAASALRDGGGIWLYYSIADRYMRRATLRAVH
jgi:predicted GH43/DUF377 family glycosyl hydrolase